MEKLLIFINVGTFATLINDNSYYRSLGYSVVNSGWSDLKENFVLGGDEKGWEQIELNTIGASQKRFFIIADEKIARFTTKLAFSYSMLYHTKTEGKGVAQFAILKASAQGSVADKEEFHSLYGDLAALMKMAKPAGQDFNALYCKISASSPYSDARLTESLQLLQACLNHDEICGLYDMVDSYEDDKEVQRGYSLYKNIWEFASKVTIKSTHADSGIVALDFLCRSKSGNETSEEYIKALASLRDELLTFSKTTPKPHQISQQV